MTAINICFGRGILGLKGLRMQLKSEVSSKGI
jgi:hypothetical protein